MIITIAGKPGSGKSTVSPLVAHGLKFKHIYVGSIVRFFASEAKKPLDVFYKELENNPEIDIQIDDYQKELLMKDDDFVLDSRIGFFWPVPEGKKKINIFLDVDPRVGALRIFKAKGRTADGKHKNAENVLRINRDRIKVERMRYRNLYGILDHHDRRHFDLVIDTSNMDPDEVVKEILTFVKSKSVS